MDDASVPDARDDVHEVDGHDHADGEETCATASCGGSLSAASSGCCGKNNDGVQAAGSGSCCKKENIATTGTGTKCCKSGCCSKETSKPRAAKAGCCKQHKEEHEDALNRKHAESCSSADSGCCNEDTEGCHESSECCIACGTRKESTLALSVPCDVKSGGEGGCCRGDQFCFEKSGLGDNSACCAPDSVCCQDPSLGNVLGDDDLRVPVLAEATAGEETKGDVTTRDILLRRLCCNGEARVVQRALLPMHGVKHVRIDVTEKRMTIEFDRDTVSEGAILAFLNSKSIGARILPLQKNGVPIKSPTVTSTFEVKKLCCASETVIIDRALATLEGVDNVRPNVVLKKLTVTHAPALVSSASIRDLLNAQGLGVAILKDGGDLLVGQATAAPSLQLPTTVFRIENLKTDAQASEIEGALAALPGVQRVEMTVATKELHLEFDPQLVTQAEISAILFSRGMPAVAISTGPSGAVVVPVVSGAPTAPGPGALKGPKTFCGRLAASLPHWNVVLALICWFLSLCHYAPGLEGIKYVGLGSIVLCLPPIALAAAQRLRYGVLDINMLMTLAVIGAIALADYSEGAAVVTLFALSDWLQEIASSRVRVAMNALLELAPEAAMLAEAVAGVGSAGNHVPVELVPVGTRLGVRAGDKFPMDGQLVAGATETHANESNLTGESRPVRKRAGDEVSAGTINLDAYVEMNVTREHEDSTVARMVRLVEEAAQQRAPTQQLIEKIARVYTPVIFLTAILLVTVPWAVSNARGREYAYVALVFLVVACPCALVISTVREYKDHGLDNGRRVVTSRPFVKSDMAYVCGLAQAAQQGILVRGGSHLETLGRLKTMAMDKTGTLTQGKFEVLAFVMDAESPLSRSEALALVRGAEGQSSHPIALALLRTANNETSASPAATSWKLAQTDLLPGKGLAAHFVHAETAEGGDDAKLVLYVGNRALAQERGWLAQSPQLAQGIAQAEESGHTAIWVGTEQHGAIAYASLGDQLRPEAREAVRALKARGVHVVMLTGDNAGAAQAVCREAGVDEFYASLRPEDKVARLAALPSIKGMVGDGVNDAPSLATADVSVSLGCIGTAVALETADVALMQDDLTSLVEAIDLGRKCFRVIVQNVTFAVVLKLAVLVITLTAYSSLWLAIASDVGGMLIVTLNAMTILRRRSSRPSLENSAAPSKS